MGKIYLMPRIGILFHLRLSHILPREVVRAHQGIRTKVHKNISLFLFQIVGYEVG